MHKSARQYGSLNDVTIDILMLLKLIDFMHGIRWFVTNMRNVFDQFISIRLKLHQFNNELIIFLYFNIAWSNLDVVSSANIFELTSFKYSGRSLMKMAKNNGQSTLSCGTPSLIVLISDITVFWSVDIFILLAYDFWNN